MIKSINFALVKRSNSTLSPIIVIDFTKTDIPLWCSGISRVYLLLAVKEGEIGSRPKIGFPKNFSRLEAIRWNKVWLCLCIDLEVRRTCIYKGSRHP